MVNRPLLTKTILETIAEEQARVSLDQAAVALQQQRLAYEQAKAAPPPAASAATLISVKES